MKLQSRRAFIERSILLSLGLLFLPYCRKKSDESPQTGKKKDIIIIGAGIAGLAAAKTLSNSIHNVKVIEASSRFGGRINTVDFGSYKADFGASWIHGINGNPLYKLANEHGISTKMTHYEPSHIFDIDGTEITAAEWKDIEKLFVKLYDLALTNPQLSIQGILDIMEPDLNLSAKLTRLWYGAMRSEYEIPYAIDPKDISARAITSNDSFSGDDVVFPAGMNDLCQVLAKGADIEYNSFVSKIDYTGTKVKVYVTNTSSVDNNRSCAACHNDNTASSISEGRVLEADQIIVALPIGMLKKRMVAFNPPLPTIKIDAIAGLGIGTMNKVFLRFSSNFWDDKAYFFEYLKDDSLKIIEFFSPSPTGASNVLVAVLAGKHAKSIETKSDAEVLDIVMSDLKAMFGNNIPQPIAMKRTAWHSNKFSLGAYPHLKPGYDMSVCDEIKKPLASKVFFAGDATTKKYLATAHGAYLSGVEAGYRILGVL